MLSCHLSIILPQHVTRDTFVNPARGYGLPFKSHNGPLIGSSLSRRPIECICSFWFIESRSHNPMSSHGSTEMWLCPQGDSAPNVIFLSHSYFCIHIDDAQWRVHLKLNTAHAFCSYMFLVMLCWAARLQIDQILSQQFLWALNIKISDVFILYQIALQ